MTACKWGNRHVCAIAMAIGMLTTLGLDARADTGPVTGTVKLPDPSLRGDPPERNRGFLPRTSNPIMAPKKYDPLQWVIVVLEPADDLSADDKQPPKVPPSYDMIGESFATPIFPVTAGGEVAIRNKSKEARRLYAPADSDLLSGDTINPNGDRIAKVSTPYKVIEIRDHESTHLSGTLVAFPLRYHALVDAAGNFTIDEVPAGKWNLRLWYRNGWLKKKKQSITVASKRGAKVDVDMPAIIEVDEPGAGAEGK